MIAGSIIMNGLLFTVAGACFGAGGVMLAYRQRWAALDSRKDELDHQSWAVAVRSLDAPRVDENMHAIDPTTTAVPVIAGDDAPLAVQYGTRAEHARRLGHDLRPAVMPAELDDLPAIEAHPVRELVAVPIAMAMSAQAAVVRGVAQARRRKSQPADGLIQRLRAEDPANRQPTAPAPVGRHTAGWAPGTDTQVATCRRDADAIMVDVSMTDEIRGLSAFLADTHQPVTFEEIPA